MLFNGYGEAITLKQYLGKDMKIVSAFTKQLNNNLAKELIVIICDHPESQDEIFKYLKDLHKKLTATKKISKTNNVIKFPTKTNR